MPGYFGSLPKLDFSGVKESVGTMPDDVVEDFLQEIEDNTLTRAERIAWIERVERGEEQLGSWDAPYPFGEFARRVRAGEAL